MVKRAGIIKSNDDSDKPKRARYAGDAESYQARESKPKTDEQEFRDQRIEVRREYTSAAKSKGADGQGMGEGTNWLYWILFGEKPKGDRDQWSQEDQAHIMTGEHFATNRIKDLPTPKEGSSQRRANDNVVEATKDGAKAAKDFLNDENTPGAAATIWGWLNPKTIWEEGEEESKK